MLGGRLKKKVLLLCNYYPGAAGTIIDHIFAFPKYSENDYFILSILGDLPGWLDLSRFDALIFHYSLIASYDTYISPAGRLRIREFAGFKAAFVQDDYRWINDTVNALAYMGIHALFPLTGPEIIDQVYSPTKLPGVRKTTVLAGYVPQDLVNIAVKPYAERNLDVGYRARKLPAWMGSHTLQKWQIAEKFLIDASQHGLKVDISCSEEDRIYGEHWIEFLTNCKATLGTESGASVCDFTGEIQRNVEAHLSQHPEESFDTLRNLYFKDEDGKILMNVISPRCFEAAALRTLMILYEGHYSGVLTPWRHYVPLKRDHSNMDEVVRILRSPEAAAEIIERAYDEVAKNERYTFKAMVELVDQIFKEEWRHTFVSAKNAYLNEEFEWFKTNFSEFQTSNTQNNNDYLIYRSAKSLNHLTIIATKRSGIEGGDAVEYILERPIKLKSVVIRWDAEYAPPPGTVKVVCKKKGRKVLEWSQENPSRKAFQIIDCSLESISIDALQVKFQKTDDTGNVLELIVVGLDSSVTTRLFKQYSVRLVYFLQLIWGKLPDRAQKVLRPLAHRLRTILEQGGLRKY